MITNQLQILTSPTTVRAALRSLEVGTVLNVEVIENNNELGILLNGKFLQANLPSSVNLGDKLQVKVVNNNELLLLKLLTNTPEGSTSISIADAFKQILKGLDLGSLAQTTRLIDQIIPSLQLNQSKDIKADGMLDSLIKTLVKQNTVLSEEILKDPEAIKKFLKELSSNDLKEILGKFKTDINSKIESKAQRDVAFLETLKGDLEELLSLNEPLSFEKRKLIASLQLSSFLPTLSNAETKQISGNNALTSFLRSLTLFKDSLGEDSFSQDISDIIKKSSSQLEELLQQKSPDKNIRAFLNKMLGQVSAKLGELEASTDTLKDIKKAKDAVNELEALANSQSTLQQLNPVMHAIGQPAMMIVPAILGGLFAKWEITANDNKVDEDKESGEHNKSATPFQKIKLHLPFPSIGNVEAEISHKEGEAFVTLTVESKEVANFLTEKFNLLSKSLSSMGYKSDINTKVGEPKSVTPLWLREFNKKELIA